MVFTNTWALYFLEVMLGTQTVTRLSTSSQLASRLSACHLGGLKSIICDLMGRLPIKPTSPQTGSCFGTPLTERECSDTVLSQSGSKGSLLAIAHELVPATL